MSTVLKAFKRFVLADGGYKKLFKNHDPGQRILPAKVEKEDAKHQLRIDAGEVIDGKKNIYLQANAQATSSAIKKYIEKNGTHGNIATATIDTEVPPEEQLDESGRVLAEFEKEFKSKIG